MQTPEFSVVMPMRNARPFVGEALRSVLADRHVDLEVIVVDDGSTDGSLSVIKEISDPRIRVVKGPGEGIAAAFNAGLAASHGTTIARCDADDSYPAGRISQQVQWLADHPEFGAVCGAFAAMNARGGSQLPFHLPEQAGEITNELRAGEIRTHLCTFAIRASILRKIGGARPFFVVGEDLDLQLRLGEACRIWYLPDIAYVYRLHDTSITHRMRTEEREFYEQQARACQIQRQRFGVDDVDMGKTASLAGLAHSEPAPASAHMQGLLIAATWSAFRARKRAAAFKNALRGAIARPAAIAGWRNLVVLLVKLAIPRRTRDTSSPEQISPSAGRPRD